MQLRSLLVVVATLLVTTPFVEAHDTDYNELVYTIMPNMTKPIVLDFWATWCAPCRQYAPTFKSVERSYGRYADFYRVDIDENSDLVQTFQIRCVPTTIVIYSKSGDYLRAESVLSHSELTSLIDRARRMLDLSNDF